jgi:hypothetical protein
MQEAEIRRIAVQSQPEQTVCKTLSQKKPHHKKKMEWLFLGVAQDVGPEVQTPAQQINKLIN